MVRVGDEVSSGLTPATKIEEDLPVTGPWGKYDHVVVVAEFADECQGSLEGCWRVKDATVREDPRQPLSASSVTPHPTDESSCSTSHLSSIWRAANRPAA